jgi:hypothetical protein
MDFPSGEWFGFYTYSSSSRRFLMDLILEFQNGIISGDGSDGVGPFTIHGYYSEASGDCGWSKTYVGRHTVDYTGFRENKGIWGTWTLLHTKGGFHIWPLGHGADTLHEEEKEKELAPLKAGVAIVSAPGFATGASRL